MRAKVAVAVIVFGLAVATILWLRHPSPKQPIEAGPQAVEGAEAPGPIASAHSEPTPESSPAARTESAALPPREITPSVPVPANPTNKLERLTQIREQFRALAAGDHVAALQAAKAIRDGTERETALLTLVTEWTRGNLRPPVERASNIAQFGLEAGLGMELAKDPELALQWANELTAGKGREVVVREVAVAMVASDPARAFSLGEEVPESDRSEFFKDVFASWGEKDTEAALNWANQLSDPADRDAAIAAIRTSAPVGIGAALRIQDGYPAIAGLVKGAPAELSGQLHNGDRIVALAQADGNFVDARDVPLGDIVKMVRGSAGSVLQLQVLASDAPAGSPPRTVSIIRDQVKFKR